MNKRSEFIRAFLIMAAGIALGFAVIKLTHGALVTVAAIVIGVLAFLWFRVRSGR